MSSKFAVVILFGAEQNMIIMWLDIRSRKILCKAVLKWAVPRIPLLQSSNTCSNFSTFYKQLSGITKVSAKLIQYNIICIKHDTRWKGHTQTDANSSAHVEVNLSSGFYINEKVFIHIITLFTSSSFFSFSFQSSCACTHFSANEMRERKKEPESASCTIIIMTHKKV